MMLRRWALAALLGAGCCAAAAGAAEVGAVTQATPVRLIPGKSTIGFVSHEMGVPVHGSFQRFTAEIDIDAEHPGESRFAVAVDLSSVQLPTDDGTTEAAKPDWLDTAQHPVARFTSTAVRPEGNGRYAIDGRLAIKGAVRTVTVPVILTQTGSGTDRVTMASGDLTIRRLDYGIGIGDWADTSVVADPVEIDFRLALTGVAAIR